MMLIFKKIAHAGSSAKKQFSANKRIIKIDSVERAGKM